jgi:hypothetical protein
MALRHDRDREHFGSVIITVNSSGDRQLFVSNIKAVCTAKHTTTLQGVVSSTCIDVYGNVLLTPLCRVYTKLMLYFATAQSPILTCLHKGRAHST